MALMNEMTHKIHRESGNIGDTMLILLMTV